MKGMKKNKRKENNRCNEYATTNETEKWNKKLG